MARILTKTKTAEINPLKSSQPLGAALAFLGIDGALPILHGSQGCTSFALVLLVRHFKQMVPLQTTAMDDIATVGGGAGFLEEAVVKLTARTRPQLIGICTTALAETRDEDILGDIVNIKRVRARELVDTEVVLARTPDFAGALEEGWSQAVTAMIEAITSPGTQNRDPAKIVILPGSNMTAADAEYLRETVESFGLTPLILPDVSGPSDEITCDQWIPIARGGTKVEHMRDLGAATQCIAVGEQMRRPAEALQGLTGVPYVMFGSLTGLHNADRFVWLLTAISREKPPLTVRRGRMQLQEAMLGGHCHLAGKKVAIASEPDQLFQFAEFFIGMGAVITAAVTTTGHSKVLQLVSADTVQVGDLGDLEHLAAEADLLVTHSHGRQAAERLAVPLMRVGFPVFDRIGSQHKLNILYRGTRDMIYDVANIVQANHDRQPHIELKKTEVKRLATRGGLHDVSLSLITFTKRRIMASHRIRHRINTCVQRRSSLVQEKPMHSVNIDINNFQSEVQKSAVPVLLDLWAEGCGPCETIAPILEEIAVEMKGRIKVAKLNLGENPELAAQFGVHVIPTLAIFKGGEIAGIFVGSQLKSVIVKWVHRTLLTSS